MNKLITILFLTTFIFSCKVQEYKTINSGGASASSINPNAPAKWNMGEFPLNIQLSNSFSANDETLITDMADEWRVLSNDEAVFFNLTSGHANIDSSVLASYNGGALGIYKSTNWFGEISSSALAITQFAGIRRGAGTPFEYIELFHADIVVNYEDHDFSNNLAGGTFDLPSVILHELGHVIGLYHIFNESNAVMAPTIGYTSSKRTGHLADEIHLAENYGINQGVIPLESNDGMMGASAQRPLYSDPSQEGEIVNGYHELRSDGSCHMYINGVEVHHNH